MDQDKPSTSFEGKPRKRTHSKIELEVEDDKTQQHDRDVPIQEKKTNKQQTTKTILDFPDEVLLCIFKNMDINNLKNLRLCCTRFSRVAADKILWNLDYSKEPILPSQMEPYETFLQPLTHTLAIRGDFQQDSENLLGHLFFSKVKQICRILNTLKIENYFINMDEVYFTFYKTIYSMYTFNKQLNCKLLGN
ncbi:uncharacterized protein LOC109862265 [Pseudomyrmex gracilis]|uniref:uncharacterized protein LOC109862265 n=1 Tax=Pseudomyrmex gracilis TaxID=219809 RepID=UPI0009957424|nr:uncharacterized protein LOC109862265 [Pseudomyrmex gracilis]XP_020297850.1 uncharacterized protein LOC109862265 [Pseudomyrmex gracilis]